MSMTCVLMAVASLAASDSGVVMEEVPLEDENPFAAKPRKLMDDLKRKYLPPKVDEHLYEL